MRPYFIIIISLLLFIIILLLFNYDFDKTWGRILFLIIIYGLNAELGVNVHLIGSHESRELDNFADKREIWLADGQLKKSLFKIVHRNALSWYLVSGIWYQRQK